RRAGRTPGRIALAPVHLLLPGRGGDRAARGGDQPPPRAIRSARAGGGHDRRLPLGARRGLPHGPPPRSPVTGIDLEGQEVTVEDEGGVLARALQHEVDHLEGSLYLDRLSPALRREALDAITARGWRARGILSWDPRTLEAEDV